MRSLREFKVRILFICNEKLVIKTFIVYPARTCSKIFGILSDALAKCLENRWDIK